MAKEIVKPRQDYDKPWKNLSASPRKSLTVRPLETKEISLDEQFQNLIFDQKTVEGPKLDRYEKMRKEALARIIAKHEDEPIKKN